jgi:hypothetical protein
VKPRQRICSTSLQLALSCWYVRRMEGSSMTLRWLWNCAEPSAACQMALFLHLNHSCSRTHIPLRLASNHLSFRAKCQGHPQLYQRPEQRKTL